MQELREPLENAFELFAELVGEDPQLEREFAETQAGFQPAGGDPARERPLAERRHLEWFLCERPSDHLGGVPMEVLRAVWTERADADSAEAVLAALLGSRAGAYEITGIAPFDGALSVRDVFGMGEYTVVEPEAAGALAVGDLLVGRLFQVGAEVFVLSPATACFRDVALVQALDEDAERMRGGRGRVLRIQQSELERLFFHPQSRGAASNRSGDATHGDYAADERTVLDGRQDGPADGRFDRTGSLGSDAPPDRDAALHEARAALRAAGLDGELTRDTLAAVLHFASEVPPRLATVTEVLNELAFETDVELEAARRSLLDLWAVLTAPATRSTTHGVEAKTLRGGARPAADEDLEEDAADEAPHPRMAAALQRFDAGRAAGEDLEQLFRQLESDLGVDEGGEEDPGQSPDFPGVVGAMVEEYLWDRGREEGDADQTERRVLRELSRYGEGIGVFENLAGSDLLDFAGRWVLDESAVETQEEAGSLLDTLADFCRWSEERHAHALWKEFERQWKELRDAVPRLVTLRRAVQRSHTPDEEIYEVAAIADERVALVTHDGSEHEVLLEQAFYRTLREGDLLRLATTPTGHMPCRVYPGVLRELLR